jgi:hypothetical protein
MELIESGLFQTAQIRLGGSWVDTEGKWQVYPPKVAVIYLWWAGATLFQWGTWMSIPHSKVINNYPHLSGDMPCIELGVYHGYCPFSDWNAHPSKYIYIYLQYPQLGWSFLYSSWHHNMGCEMYWTIFRMMGEHSLRHSQLKWNTPGLLVEIPSLRGYRLTADP